MAMLHSHAYRSGKANAGRDKTTVDRLMSEAARHKLACLQYRPKLTMKQLAVV